MRHFSPFLTLVATLIIAGPAASETFTLFNDARDDAFVAFGQPKNAGDMILWHSNMETGDGAKVGTGSGTCTRLDQQGNYFCDFVIHHQGHGILAGSGVQRVEPQP
jgi:hypothetical protein